MENIVDNNNGFELCKLWAETIHQNILDSFAYYGYLQGLDEFFKSYKYKDKLSIACREFIKHQK